MRIKQLILLLLLSAILLSGCRFAVIETGSVRIAPTAGHGDR
jgi:hypothetical protein